MASALSVKKQMTGHRLLLLLLLAASALAAASTQEPVSFIVVFKKGTDAAAVRAACAEAEAASSGGRFSGTCTQRFSSVLNGFSGSFTPGNLSRVLSAFSGQVAYVERDAAVHITGDAQPKWISSDWLPGWARPQHGEGGGHRRRLQQLLGRQHRRGGPRRRALPQQKDPGWNLDRIDQREPLLDGLYHYDAMGTGVNVYVIDTGIRFTHSEFRTQQGGGGSVRARPGFSAFGDDDTSDCNGHGTHTAATIGGLTYGVAKNVTLWAVRAMDCKGDSSVSVVLSAFEWIAANHQQPALVSMSVTGQLSPAVNEAARRLVEEHGVPVVVAAGNNYAPACQMSPAGSPAVITVGASDELDQRWALSNWGPCVDIHAPGVDVVAAVNTSDTATKEKTGTSMATPHVTGVIALYLEKYPGASPAEVRQQLNAAAEVGILKDDPVGYGTWQPSVDAQALDISSTPNRLLYSLLVGQATFSPPTLIVGADGAPVTVAVALSQKPSAAVVISMAAPVATWAAAPLASASPSSWTVQPGSWSQPVFVTLAPGSISAGTYFLTLKFTSEDPAYDGTIQTLKVFDVRPLTGDLASSARIVAALPFTDVDDTSRFHDDYLYAGPPPVSGGAPDVVYAVTVTEDIAVDISTCGSLFDTVLYVLDDPLGQQGHLANDDDTACESNPKASRISTTFQAGRTYFVVVDGYASGWLESRGTFKLSIYPSSGSDAQ